MTRTQSLALPLLLALPPLAVAAEDRGACRAAIAVAEAEAALPAGLLHAIGRTESGRRDPATGRIEPWPWALNAAGMGLYAATREEAVATVLALQARGLRSIDVGCLQVNLLHHPGAFASVEDAFDPLANARYAAGFLRELQARAGGDWGLAVARYHSATPERGEAYRLRVMASLAGGAAALPVAPSIAPFAGMPRLLPAVLRIPVFVPQAFAPAGLPVAPAGRGLPRVVTPRSG